MEKSDSGIKDDGALATCFDFYLHLVVVHHIGGHARNVRGRRRGEVRLAQERTQRVRLDLCTRQSVILLYSKRVLRLEESSP